MKYFNNEREGHRCLCQQNQKRMIFRANLKSPSLRYCYSHRPNRRDSLLSQFFVVFWIITRSYGKCIVHDRHDKAISLEPGVLPYGVRYDKEKDTLECGQANSCRYWKIKSCAHVLCHHDMACQEADMMENNKVTCSSYGACQNAYIGYSGAHNPGRLRSGEDGVITCGGNQIRQASDDLFCANAEIETNSKVFCHGPGACVASHNTDTGKVGTKILVGSSGQVHCGNSLSREISCANMIIYIQFGHRACVDYDQDKARACALVCYNEWDCDINTIQFHVE